LGTFWTIPQVPVMQEGLNGARSSIICNSCHFNALGVVFDAKNGPFDASNGSFEASNEAFHA
jgi:hypothetical protein